MSWAVAKHMAEWRPTKDQTATCRVGDAEREIRSAARDEFGGERSNNAVDVVHQPTSDVVNVESLHGATVAPRAPAR